MKRILILSTLIITLTGLFSCNKPLFESTSATTNESGSFTSLLIRPMGPTTPIDPIKPILAPGQTEYCIPSQSEFYLYLWGYMYGPPVACPYVSLAQKACKVTFTDGSTITCQQTAINQFGTIGYGGIALQDISCSGLGDPFLSYIILTYYSTYPATGQSSATFPLYSCNYSSPNYPASYGEIRMLKNGISYILHSTVTSYSYPENGQMVTKTIRVIEFI